jgi:NAD(P)-dependent dehydrogenase (short-subunit alcohol dehydrogenase family)
VGSKRDFKDKAVVITGAASGIGLSLTRRFLRAGSRVAMLDINDEALRKASSSLGSDGGKAIAVYCDVSEERSVKEAYAKTVEALGTVDCLVNNAGISARAAFSSTQIEVFRRVMGVNFFGSLYCTKCCLEALLERRGMIITISSIAGFSPLLGRTAYAASKHALHGLFDSLRSELRGSGVDVLIVCPGFTATAIGTSALDGDGTITRHPQSVAGKAAHPDDVAEAVFKAASRGRRMLVLSRAGRLGMILNKISPPLYEALMVRAVRSELQR